MWREKVAFVTGGSSGIGAALTAKLAEAGAEVDSYTIDDWNDVIA